jgi:predicted ester cyclase
MAVTSVEQNKAASRRALAELDKGNVGIMDEVCAPDVVVRFPGFPPLDIAGFKQFIKLFYSAFPDLVHEIKDMIGEGDKVARAGVFSGTHKGEFQGMPPTGKRIEVAFTAVDRFKDGKLVELNGLMDTMTMMRQLGAVPAEQA